MKSLSKHSLKFYCLTQGIMVVWRGQNNAPSVALKIALKTKKFTKRSGIISKCPVYYLVHIILYIFDTHYIQKRDHFNFLNCFARSKFCQVFYRIWRFYIPHINKPWRHYAIGQFEWNKCNIKTASFCTKLCALATTMKKTNKKKLTPSKRFSK